MSSLKYFKDIGTTTNQINIGQDTSSSVDSIALGINVSTSSPATICLGNNSKSTGTGCISLGCGLNANTGSSSYGTNTISIGGSSTAYVGAQSNGVGSIAIGTAGSVSFGPISTSGGISIGSAVNGSSARVDSTNGISIGCGGYGGGGQGAFVSSSTGGIAIGSAGSNGNGAVAGADNSIAIGSGRDSNAGAKALGGNSIAIGSASSGGGGAYGAYCQGSALGGIGIGSPPLNYTGSGPRIVGEGSIGIGSGISAYGKGPYTVGSCSIAIGSVRFNNERTTSRGVDSIAIGGSDGGGGAGYGRGAYAADRCISIGSCSRAQGENSIAIGSARNIADSTSTENNGCIAIGNRVKVVGGKFATAIGNYSYCRGNEGLAIGANSNVQHDGTICIGSVTSMTQGFFVQSNLLAITVSNPATLAFDTTTGQIGTDPSSIKYKKNIVDLEDMTNTIVKLRPKRFDMIQSHQTNIGLIAEEVVTLLPEIVPKDKTGQPMTVEYAKLVVPLLQLVQKMKIIQDDLTKRINILELKN